LRKPHFDHETLKETVGKWKKEGSWPNLDWLIHAMTDRGLWWVGLDHASFTTIQLIRFRFRHIPHKFSTYHTHHFINYCICYPFYEAMLPKCSWYPSTRWPCQCDNNIFCH
jgi:hypothetical protein